MMKTTTKRDLLAEFLEKLPDNLVFKLLEISSTGFELDDIDFKASREHRLLHLVWRSSGNPRCSKNNQQLSTTPTPLSPPCGPRTEPAKVVKPAGRLEMSKPKLYANSEQPKNSVQGGSKHAGTPPSPTPSTSASDAGARSSSNSDTDTNPYKLVTRSRRRSGDPSPAPHTRTATVSAKLPVANRFDAFRLGEEAVEEAMHPPAEKKTIEEEEEDWGKLGPAVIQAFQELRTRLSAMT